MTCPDCRINMTIAQDEPFGRMFVCPNGHWWNYDYKTLFLDRLHKGEKDAT